MFSSTTSIIYIFETLLAALLTTLLASVVCIPLAQKVRLIDLPGSAPHKQHKKSAPLAGGLTLFITVMLLSYALGLFKDMSIRSALIARVANFLFWAMG